MRMLLRSPYDKTLTRVLAACAIAGVVIFAGCAAVLAWFVSSVDF